MRVCSSVVERHSDKMEVGGSTPPTPKGKEYCEKIGFEKIIY